MHIYSLPQEIEVWYVIPSIRKELAKLLTHTHGLSYDKAGLHLGISKAAISQYNKNKRAGNVKLPIRVLREIEKSAKRISKNKDLNVKEILRVLNFMRKNKISFEYCKPVKHDHKICKDIVLAYEQHWDC